MKLHIDYVIDALAEHEPVVSPPPGETPFDIDRIEFYVGQPVEPGVLYIADEHAQIAEQGAFLVAGAMDMPAHGFIRVAGTSAAEAFNRVFRHCSLIENCLDELRTLYYERRDLPAFCQLLADFVDNPVTAYDDALLPIAQSAFSEEFARQTFGSASMTDEYVFREIPRWTREGNPYPIPMEGFDSPNAFRTYSRSEEMSTAMCGVITGGATQGFLEIFQVAKHITDGDMRLLEEACRILAMPYPFEENRFIASRLEGRMTQQDLTNAWMSALRWNDGDHIFVVVVNLPPEYSNSMHNMDRAMRVFRSLVPSSVSVQMGNVPVLVANSRFISRKQAISIISQFLQKAETEHHIGASEMLVGIGNLHEGYVHAQFAAQFGERKQRGSSIMRFEDCQFAYFREVCALDQSKDLVIDANVARMHADDLKAQTDNVLTAKTFIETGFNLNATAQAISIHRNTAAYRLKQIADRYGIDLSAPVSDPGLVFRVLLSCKILLGDS